MRPDGRGGDAAMNPLGGDRPKLRPVEAFPIANGSETMFALRDPTGIAEQTLTLSEPALFILMHFDGNHTLADVARFFSDRYGQSVRAETLHRMVEKLRSGKMLEGPEVEAHVAALVSAYRSAPVRPPCYSQTLGERAEVESLLDEMVPLRNGPARHEGYVVGLVAPHLDYARGWPCYAGAYGVLRGRRVPQRVCVLGTNHFGRGTSVVATSKAFATPLGVTEVDVDFVRRVERACGHDLHEHEFDHKREHSVEIQVLCLQHVFGVNSFKLVPLLCPDPTGPTGTKPANGRGVDLGDFAEALAKVLGDDEEDTLLVAGADLSHVGLQFGDRVPLDEAFLRSVESRDRAVLGRLEASDPEAFVEAVAEGDNATRVCSAGCLYVVGRVLREATPKLLRYHQALTPEQQICVSCAALTYVR